MNPVASMVIRLPGALSHHICRGGRCRVEGESTIETFYSEKHARDAGWMYLRGPSIALQETGGLCPDCLSALEQRTPDTITHNEES